MDDTTRSGDDGSGVVLVVVETEVLVGVRRGFRGMADTFRIVLVVVV